MPRIATDNVQFKGIDELGEEEKAFLDKIVPEYYEKIKMLMDNLTQLELHFKTLRNTGERKMYDIKIKVKAPTRVFASSNSLQNEKEAWQFSKALHGAFKDVEMQIKKAFEKDQSHPRPRE